MSDILDRGLTHAQMRETILRKDRAQRFGAEDPKNVFAIVSRKGRVVARCESLDDRDFLMRAAQAHDELVEALEAARDIIADTPGPDSELVQIDTALAKARQQGEPLASTENMAGGLRP